VSTSPATDASKGNHRQRKVEAAQSPFHGERIANHQHHRDDDQKVSSKLVQASERRVGVYRKQRRQGGDREVGKNKRKGSATCPVAFAAHRHRDADGNQEWHNKQLTDKGNVMDVLKHIRDIGHGRRDHN
jgi:hypothetical protein